MLDSSLIPSRLVDPTDPTQRRQVDIVTPVPPSRFRSLQIICGLAKTLLVAWWLRRKPREAGRRVREYLEQTGTLWIRAGQIIALRRDRFPREFCDELDKIRDWANGFPFEMAKKIAEEELCAPLDSYFDEIQERPFVASTVAQIHMAHLRRENVWVAVNIQRPYAREIFAQDMKLIRWITRLISKFRRWRHVRLDDLCHELEQIVHKELDYRYESSLTLRLKETLANHGIYLHSVFRDYSSQRMLVTEFIRGALMSDYVRLTQKDPRRLEHWLNRNNIKPQKLAKRLFESIFRQVFEDNLFHGDIRSTNMVLLRDSEFSVLDTRSVSSTETETLQKFRMFINALANEEFEIAADLFLLSTSVLPRVDTVEVRKDMIRMWKTWTLRTHIREMAYNEKSLSYMFSELNRIVRKYKFAVQWKVLYTYRTIANMDAIIQHLAPETNCLKWIRSYFVAAKRRESRNSIRDSQVTALRLFSKVREMPQRLAGYALFQDIVLRRQVQVISGTTAKAGYLLGSMSAIASILFFLTEIFLVCAFLEQKQEGIGAALLGRQLTEQAQRIPLHEEQGAVWFALLVVVVPTLFFFNRRMAKHFRGKDVRIPQASFRV